MAKKVKMKQAANEQQKHEADAAERAKMVQAFNERFAKFATLSEGVDEEYKAQVTAEADELTKNFNELMLEVTPDHNTAVAYAEIMREWNAKWAKWTNKEWHGVITFDKHINEIIEALNNDPESGLKINVYDLLFFFEHAKEPCGTGLESARQMAALENCDENGEKIETAKATFIDCLNAVLKQMQYLETLNKKANILQQRVAMADSNYRLDLKCTELEEFARFHDLMMHPEMPVQQQEALEEVENTAVEQDAPNTVVEEYSPSEHDADCNCEQCASKEDNN